MSFPASTERASWWDGRLWRLCQKELRETLRDRRTIVTLLLMPILVYPLLCIAMNRLLVSGGTGQGRPTYVIGVKTERDGEAILEIIKAGSYWLQQRPYQPIRVHRYSNASGSKGEEPIILGADRDVPLFDVKLLEIDEGVAIKEGLVELVGWADPLSHTSTMSDGIKPHRFRVNYRQDDGRSEAALVQFQRLLQVLIDVEDADRARQLGRDMASMVELKAEPVRMKSGSANSLLTVIPLVLLLMTITGAVYPAIDLTAGERERGTMESLIASPVPRFALLLSKYVAVVTVAMLTAIANLTSMWVTLSVTGIGEVLLGSRGMPFTTLLLILPLLLIFSCFFSAVLLALCSFAKSFKEAQAYLIPVMLVSLAPGILSLLPGIEFGPLLAVVPLVNMILLARDILTDSVTLVPALGAIVSTIIYAAAVLAIAARLFGADATQHAGQNSWSDLWRRPSEVREYPSLDQLFLYMACFYPIYFVGSNLAGQVASLGWRIAIGAMVTLTLFGIMPGLYAVHRRLDSKRTFRLQVGSPRWPLGWLGALVLATSLWTVSHQLVILSTYVGITTITEAQRSLAMEAKAAMLKLPFAYVVLCLAVIPAMAEEFFFRGFVLSSLRRLEAWKQIGISAVIFGGFHVVSGAMLSVEKFLPSTFLGLVLGWIAYRTRSLYPGMVLHAGHNGLMFALVFYEEWFKERGFDVAEGAYLPWSYVGMASLMMVLGVGLVWGVGKQEEVAVGLEGEPKVV